MNTDSVSVVNNNMAKATFQDKHKVDYRDIDFDRVYCPVPSSRQIPGKGANQNYMGCNVMYQINDIGSDKPIYEELRLEGPPMHSRSGIGELVDDKGVRSYNIYTPLDPKNEELMYFKTEVLDGIHDVLCEYAAKYASYIGKNANFNKNVAVASIPSLYKYPKDKITKQTLTDKTPFLSNKVSIVGDNATIFIDLDRKIVPWRKLVGMEMEYVPLYKLSIYSGGGGTVLTFPMKMSECLVLWYRPIIVTSSQSNTVDKYREKYLEEYKKSLEILSTHSSVPTSSLDDDNTLGIVSRDVKKEDNEAKVETKANPPIRRGLREKNK